jgi:RNA polymerase sigma-70 factor (ECF subfamily)
MAKKSLPTKAMDKSADDFQAAYEANSSSIYRFLYWRTRDTELAEDLTSSVFEKAWRSRKRFQGGSIKAWLYKIAQNTLIDHWRKTKERAYEDIDILPGAVSDTNLNEDVDKALALEHLQRAVNQLPENMRTVVETRFIKGWPAKKVAAKLGISEGNVRITQYRALKILRSYLDEK